MSHILVQFLLIAVTASTVPLGFWPQSWSPFGAKREYVNFVGRDADT